MLDSIDQKVVDVFGRNQLQTAPRELVADWNIPQSSKKFLTTVGLPDVRSLLLEFVLDVDAWRDLLQEVLVRCGDRVGGATLRPLAREAHRYLCVDEQSGAGQVVSVDPDDVDGDLLVNTSVELLGLTLALYRETCEQSVALGGAGRIQIARTLDQKLREIDPEEFAGESKELSWWALVTEQMKDDLM